MIPMTTVTGFEQLADGTWQVRAVRTGRWVRRQKKTFTATYLVLAAGTWGTQRLLFKMRDKGKLPKLSDRLGVLTRTNSESIVGAGKLEVSPDLDLTHGVAITSSIHPTPDTHIEPVRYGKGSNAMGLLQTLMTDGPGPEGTDVPRWRQLIQNVRKDPRGTLRLLNVHRWSERTLIALVMQHLDNSITTFTKRGMFGRRRYSSKQGHGEPNPTWIPIGNKVTRRIAEKIDGVAGGTWGELFNIPLTAHFLGGAAIGDSPEHGVIDPYQRVYGYPTLSVHDGAAVSANLGVNPSLSITAQAERAASLWPNKGQKDLRPAQGEPYRRLAPIPPEHPVVPADAPGALRWPPIEPVSSAASSPRQAALRRPPGCAGRARRRAHRPSR
ncbi:GMC oxidoreductase family protein [Mycobacterium xenopi 3993]|nr:GMC oxidoreductase family protein [Mycobacterium xenopi 3993]